MEETGGKNLHREIVSHKNSAEKITEKDSTLNTKNFFEVGVNAEAV